MQQQRDTYARDQVLSPPTSDFVSLFYSWQFPTVSSWRRLVFFPRSRSCPLPQPPSITLSWPPTTKHPSHQAYPSPISLTKLLSSPYVLAK